MMSLLHSCLSRWKAGECLGKAMAIIGNDVKCGGISFDRHPSIATTTEINDNNTSLVIVPLMAIMLE